MRLLPTLGAALTVLVFTAAPAARADAPPMLLPGDAAASAVRAASQSWLVGGRPSSRTDAIARRHDARAVSLGAFEVPRHEARPLAAALRRQGLLVYAEPNRLSLNRQAPRAIADDPLSPNARWRDFVVDPAIAPPAVTPQSPLLVLIDSKLDAGHPEFGGGNVVTAEGETVADEHGTATAAVAAAPKNDVGILGIWPGMRALNVPLPQRISCADSTRGIVRAVDAGAAVINMSYGSSDACFTEFAALQRATAKGVNLVAAAGNEFDDGNPLEFPASLPHVLTVAAITPDDKSAFFSNENAAMDLAAPGVGILTAVPAAFDSDGTVDGYQGLSGTSFSAPMVAAATTWLRAARPELTVDQAAQVMRLSARDVGDPGWEPSTGFGVLNVGAALQKAPPPKDPSEPNEDIVWVDGSVLDKVAKPIFTGAAKKLIGLLDVFEDPSDVYRIRIPARARVTASVKPVFGDPDLAVYDRGADSVGDRGAIIDSSNRRGSKTDTVRVRNTSRRAATAYVRVFVPEGRASLDAGYRLTIRRR